MSATDVGCRLLLFCSFSCCCCSPSLSFFTAALLCRHHVALVTQATPLAPVYPHHAKRWNTRICSLESSKLAACRLLCQSQRRREVGSPDPDAVRPQGPVPLPLRFPLDVIILVLLLADAIRPPAIRISRRIHGSSKAREFSFVFVLKPFASSSASDRHIRPLPFMPHACQAF